MPIVHGRFDGGVTGGTPPGPAWYGSGPSVGIHPPPLPPYSMIYMVSFPQAARSVEFPVEGYRGRVSTRTNLRIHFVYHHVRYMIVIMEEGNRPHPHCPVCDMFFPWSILNQFRPTTVIFARGANRNRRHLLDEEAWSGTGEET